MKLLIGLVTLFFTPPVGNLCIDERKMSPEEIEIILERHNYWRNDVSVDNLMWSNELASVAGKWAKALKKDKCGFYHSDFGFGENLWKGTSGAFSIEEVIDSWASEKKDYDYKNNKCNPGTMCGHYTQMIWETTSKVGCAKITCDDSTIWVCEYDPPGNWIDKKPY